MRILPNLQGLLGLGTRSAEAPQRPVPAKGIPTTLSFVDSAAISAQAQVAVPAVEPRPKGLTATLRQTVQHVVNRVRPQKHEVLLAQAQRVGAAGRLARQQATAVAALPASAVVAMGSARIRIIPAKAIDFGFEQVPSRRRR